MKQKTIVIVGIFVVVLWIFLGAFSVIPWQVAGVIVAGTIGIATLLLKLQKPETQSSLQARVTESTVWNPYPKINFTLSQVLRRTLIFPQVGWEAYNDSPYQLRVRIEVHPILGKKDLHPLPDDYINGKSVYPVEPNSWVFANGCFTLPRICATSNDELILEIRSTVQDMNDLKKGQYKLIPRRWKYNRKSETWSYHPQELMPE
jgi:hypothetical protein